MSFSVSFAFISEAGETERSGEDNDNNHDCVPPPYPAHLFRPNTIAIVPPANTSAKNYQHLQVGGYRRLCYNEVWGDETRRNEHKFRTLARERRTSNECVSNAAIDNDRRNFFRRPSTLWWFLLKDNALSTHIIQHVSVISRPVCEREQYFVFKCQPTDAASGVAKWMLLSHYICLT